MTTTSSRVLSTPTTAAAPAAAIAVIGIGCRFPGQAIDPHTLWRNLLAGTDSVSEVPTARWNADRHFPAANTAPSSPTPPPVPL